MLNFSSSIAPEYYTQKWHYNLGNRLLTNETYKSLNPIRARYDYAPNEYTQMPIYLGVVPQFWWLYGNLDYNMDKHHKHYQAHDDWLPDRKNKTLGAKQGGFNSPIMKNSKYMQLIPSKIPRGCFREIRNYQACAKDGAECLEKKISIMEVCPDHILEGLRERKKWLLRAELIDNETYRRAMEVSDFNRGRSVSDLKLKTWEHGTAANMRSDSYWQDDRYDPTKYTHAHRDDNVNNPEQEYSDFFGGTKGGLESAEYEKYRIDVGSGQSQAMREHVTEKKRASLKDLAKEVDDLNKK